MAYSSRYSLRRRSRRAYSTRKGVSGRKRRSLKKTSRKSSTSTTKKMLQEIETRLRRGSPQELVLRSEPKGVPFYSGQFADACCFRVPVTQVIPTEPGVGVKPDPRYRRGGKVYIKGVRLTVKLSFNESVQWQAALYPVMAVNTLVDVITSTAGMPRKFVIGFQDKAVGRRLLTPAESGVMSSVTGSPFLMVPGDADNTYELKSSDGSIFGCALSRKGATPFGSPKWTIGGSKTEYRGQKLAKHEFHVSSGMRAITDGVSHAQFDTREVNIYWDIQKDFEFVSPFENTLVDGCPLEILFAVRAMDTSGVVTGEGRTKLEEFGDKCVPNFCGKVHGVTAMIYYSSSST
jgi:hypothetical protein